MLTQTQIHLDPLPENLDDVIRFAVGVRYWCRSFRDYDCIWRFTVTARTTQTITIIQDDQSAGRRRRVRIWQGVEHVDPLGRYSMSPVLSADRPEGQRGDHDSFVNDVPASEDDKP